MFLDCRVGPWHADVHFINADRRGGATLCPLSLVTAGGPCMLWFSAPNERASLFSLRAKSALSPLGITANRHEGPSMHLVFDKTAAGMSSISYLH